MIWNQGIHDFILTHIEDDTDSLLFSASRYPDIDVPWVVEQIGVRRRLRSKLPEWFAVSDDLIMSGRVPAEQCSSETTARYKRGLVVGDSLCDMTGGMGVDVYYMSRGLSRAIYTERQSMLCEAARHNFAVLGADNIIVREGDGRSLPIPDVDTIYLDPARRGENDKRLYDVADCEPDVSSWQDELLSHCRHLITKVSPMIDIESVLKRLRRVTAIHVVAVKGECKEVIIEQEGLSDGDDVTSDVMCHCVDFQSSETIKYDFMISGERQSSCVYSDGIISDYLYEPDVTLMKAKSFHGLCDRYGVRKLDKDVHVFTSPEYVADFPGRRFRVDEVYPFSSKLLKSLRRSVPKANITARGFVLTADELRRKTGVKDGGDVYLFAVSTAGVRYIVKCSKL